MTSPRTPRQWTHMERGWRDNEGCDTVRDSIGGIWKRSGRDPNLWTKSWQGTFMWLRVLADFGPLSEVLPEAPEPPRGDEDGLISPPWTDETVAALNDFQRRGGMHPFTCPREHFTPGEAVLVATTEGWVCCRRPACGYVQDWAHSFMADRSAWPKWPVPASQSVPAVPVSSTGGKETGEAAETATEALRDELVDLLDAAMERNQGASLDSIEAWDFDTDLLPIADAILVAGWRPPLPDVPSSVADAIEFVLVRFIEGPQSRDVVRGILTEAFRASSLPGSETERLAAIGDVLADWEAEEAGRFRTPVDVIDAINAIVSGVTS